MERALNKLDAMVSEAMTIELVPGAPERLAADIEVAAAAKQALGILRVVQVVTFLQYMLRAYEFLMYLEENPAALIAGCPYSLLRYVKGHLQASFDYHWLCGMQAKESKYFPHRQEH